MSSISSSSSSPSGSSPVRTNTTAAEWFKQGDVCSFDAKSKTISSSTFENHLVWQRTHIPSRVVTDCDTRWITFLPGFVEGSFGFSKVEAFLQRDLPDTPRLFLDYSSSGGSKQSSSNATIATRADLVQAMWEHFDIHRTVVVACDYSSLVLMELLRRCSVLIEHVYLINGVVFSDCPTADSLWGTQLLQDNNRLFCLAAQRSNLVLKTLLQQQLLPEGNGHDVQEVIRAVRHLSKRPPNLYALAGQLKREMRDNPAWDMRQLFRKDMTLQLLEMNNHSSEESEHYWLVRERLSDAVKEGAVSLNREEGGPLLALELPHAISKTIADMAKKEPRTSCS